MEKTLLKFDKKYTYKIDEEIYSKRSALYEFYLKFKIDYFSGPIQQFSNIIEISFLSILLIVNEPIYVLVLSISFILTLLFKFLFKAKEENRVIELEKMENEYLGKQKQINTIRAIDILKKAYNISRFNEYISIVTIFIDLTLCLLLCLFSSVISLNYLLFSIMSIVYIQSKFSLVVDHIFKRNKMAKNKAYFIGYFK